MKQVTGFHIQFNPLTNSGRILIHVEGTPAPITVPIANDSVALLTMQLLLTGNAKLDPAGNIVVEH
jgi:hypothetical protein